MTSTPDHASDLDADAVRFLTAYRPTGLSDALWLPIARDAIDLVLRAGPVNRGRVEKDIQTLGAVAAHLLTRGRPLTLDELVGDATLLDYDLALERGGASGKTRENRRGILRRLQAAHHDLPWRRDRRPDGERANHLPRLELAAELNRVLQVAEHSADAGAAELVTAVSIARRARNGENVKVTCAPDAWKRARLFAGRHGLKLDARLLAAAITHDVLLNDQQPLAVIAASAGLTQRDFELGLTHAAALPDDLSADHRAALRGV